jgi:hypothetical protein
MSMIGEDAAAAGYNLVPDTGEEGRVRWGAREINRTRDYIARVLGIIPSGKAAYRTSSGITSGTAAPNNADGENGDIYLKTLP